MRRIKTVFKRSFIILLILLQVTSFPRISFADDPAVDPAATSSSTAPAPADAPAPVTPAPATTGPGQPTGADSRKYHYNEATGLWENDYYTWDQKTGITYSKKKPGYGWNPNSGKWVVKDWRYDAPSGKYVQYTYETATPPPYGSIPSTPPIPIATTSNASPSNDSDNNKQAAKSLGLADSSDHDSPDDSTGLSASKTNTGLYTNLANNNIANNVASNAQSGDVAVASNTLAGNALSGDALTQATVLNMLQSVWNPGSGQIATFTANIDGDVTGDLTIDPGQIPQTGLNSNTDNTNKLTINSTENTNLTNNVDLNAGTGNVAVNKNTSVGDATSGTATAVANVVNLLNSIIGSGQSFVGTININGNLNGDILLPPDMLNDLLASNVPRATLDTSQLNNSNILAQFNDNTNITNNVSANAATGAVTASKNTTVGDVTSGNADTNVTILNLTGRQIVGSDALLVFVNVMGKWVGMIMNTPGATSAAIGGGITSDTTNNLDADITDTHNLNILNNINVNAKSGDVDATKNTTAGNVTSGDAKAAANIANVSNSKLSLSNWFGVLFINVFGNWLGSFGVNTSAGDKPAVAKTETTAPEVKVFKFVPASSGSFSLASVPTSHSTGTGSSENSDTPIDDGSVLGASTVEPVYGGVTLDAPNNIAKVYLSLAFVGLVIMSAGKLFGFLKARKAAAVITNSSI